MERHLYEILACPVCKGKLYFDEKQNELICVADRLAYPVKDNIPVMLTDEARKISDEEYNSYKERT